MQLANYEVNWLASYGQFFYGKNDLQGSIMVRVWTMVKQNLKGQESVTSNFPPAQNENNIYKTTLNKLTIFLKYWGQNGNWNFAL